MKKYLLILIFTLLFSSVLIVNAQSEKTQSDPIPQSSSGEIRLTNPLGDITTPQSLIGRVINSVLGIVGSIALLMFVYGGLTWMISSGNQEKVKKGKDILVWSAIGLVVIFMAYTLTRLLLSSLTQ